MYKNTKKQDKQINESKNIFNRDKVETKSLPAYLILAFPTLYTSLPWEINSLSNWF